MRGSLERFSAWLDREAPQITASLQRGLSPTEMRQIMGAKDASYRLPDEVLELYAWRNGQAGNLPFFGVMRFQPFEEAVEYANLVEGYFEGTFPLMIFQELGYDAGFTQLARAA